MSVLFEIVSRRSNSCMAALTIPVSRPDRIMRGNPCTDIQPMMASATFSLLFPFAPYNPVYLELAQVIAVTYLHPFLATGNPSMTSISSSEFGNLYFNIVTDPCSGSFRRFAHWQIWHVSVNIFTCLVISGHHMTSSILLSITFAPGCPTSGVA